MSVSDHVASFGAVATAAGMGTTVATAVAGSTAAGVAVAAGATIAVGMAGPAFVVMAGAIGVADPKAKLDSGLAGGLAGIAAVVFTLSEFGTPAPELIPQPLATTASAQSAEGACKVVQTRNFGKNGSPIELILPPGCALTS